MRTGLAAAGLACIALVAGCGEKDEVVVPETVTEKADRPTRPPAGWRTAGNPAVGFTISVPHTWTVRRQRSATVVRSADRLLVMTLAADRSELGRTTAPDDYALEALESLPGFTAPLRAEDVKPFRGSPYESAQAIGAGTLAEGRQRQKVSVTTFQRPGQVTYSAVVFQNARVRPRANAGTLTRILRSFRAQPPAP